MNSRLRAGISGQRAVEQRLQDVYHPVQISAIESKIKN